MDVDRLRAGIEALSRPGTDVRGPQGEVADEVMAALDRGALRAAEPSPEGDWTVNAWVKQAILFYMTRRNLGWIGDPRGDGPAYYDRMPIKRDYDAIGVRCVPPAIARYGSFLGRRVVLMAGYVNVGAFVDEETLVDTWATVGSCAQIGKQVHLSGGVGIGGVLEPAQASPVIVEDGAFVGSRCILVEGVRIEREAVLGAGVVLTASTPIVDVRGERPLVMRGRVPARAVVIPGTMPKRFAAGEFATPCALIIGERSASTDRKTSLNGVLRDFEVAV